MLDTEPSAADETAAAAAPTGAGAPTPARRRVRKFDRPPPPKDWRWWVSGVGKALIAAGLLMFGFVAYQLWGTGIENARAQASLESEFEELLAEVPPTTAAPTAGDDTVPDSGSDIEPDTDTDPGPAAGDDAGSSGDADPSGTEDTRDDVAAAVPVEEQNIPEVLEGDPIARLEIPRIGADDIVVAGVSKGDLKKGPGHFPETPLPGQLGNAAIAGHRTTYGQPFFDVDKLEPGDEIITTTLSGRFVYRVTGTEIVSPSDYWVVSTTDPTVARLTLTSCHPKWTARDRIIVFAELDPGASTPVGAPLLNYGRVDDTGGSDASTDATDPAASVTPESAPADPVADSAPADAVPADSVPADSVPADSVPAEPAEPDTAAATAPTADASGLASEEIDAGIAALGGRLDELELRALFVGEYDERDAVCEIHSGAGGTDSQDWAEMLLRLYQRWAERSGFEVEMEEASPGQEAGITTATFIVKGRHAYGWLKGEGGVHRLIRISPFDSQARRHTAFASMMVVPALDDEDDEIEIDEKDLRIDTYRSSGAGGQHVNVTDSAVRITHLPTGIVTSCQNERSQHQNRDKAMQIMRAKLADLRRQERQEHLEELAGDQRSADFANQIRSYFLHPEQRVKDHRTDREVGNVEAVLDGEIQDFMEAWLSQQSRA